jgi:DNA-binding NarL/FixJ family response regulator
MRKLRVLLADDHPLLRSALRDVIDAQQDMEVVAEAPDGPEAIAQALRLKPDLAILDVSMPGMTGAETARTLRRDLTNIKILALSAYEDEGYAQHMLSAGADGYVPKRTSAADLLCAIRQVAAGETHVDPALAQRFDSLVPGKVQAAETESELTHTEKEVLKRLAQGYPVKLIASTMGLESAIVDQHRADGIRKLGLKTRADIARYAVQQGWLESAALT